MILITKIESVNLCLSSLCTGNCIFCPTDRGINIKEKNMSFETVQKIVDELCSDEFNSKHNLNRMQIGENGDALLNPDFLKIVRYIKLKLPKIKLYLFTNFERMYPSIIDSILNENLIYSIAMNIDGYDKESYNKVKKCDFDRVISNLRYFVSKRTTQNCQIFQVFTIDFNKYYDTILAQLHKMPIKCGSTSRNDASAAGKTMNFARDMTGLGEGYAHDSNVFGWAERDQFTEEEINRLEMDKYACTNLARMEKEEFIAPDGSVYICCFDAKFEKIIGNIYKNTLSDIHGMKETIYEKLRTKQFRDLGAPCNTVNCCKMLR